MTQDNLSLREQPGAELATVTRTSGPHREVEVPQPPGPAAGDAPRRPAAGRDGYLDLLRALALVRVVTYHAFGWAWLSLVFPSMGVMFALAGSLMARSLARPAASVIRSRMRRLLVPFWAFALVIVTAMFVHGWGPGRGGDPVTWWAKVGYWILPLQDPPSIPWAEQATGPLWYIRTYLWLVLLSPLLLRAFRRFPWMSILGFVLLTAVLQAGVVPLPGRLEGLESALTDVATFGACWLLGFAHRDGLLDRIPPEAVAALAVATAVLGGWFALAHQTDEGYDLGEIPLAQALWSIGFVLVLLRFRPRALGDWARRGRLGRVVTVLNARAVTVYLWHEIALIVCVPLIDLMWNVPAFEDHLPLDSQWFLFVLAWPLIGVAVLGLGWIEDVAARRRPRLWP